MWFTLFPNNYLTIEHLVENQVMGLVLHGIPFGQYYSRNILRQYWRNGSSLRVHNFLEEFKKQDKERNAGLCCSPRAPRKIKRASPHSEESPTPGVKKRHLDVSYAQRQGQTQYLPSTANDVWVSSLGIFEILRQWRCF